MNKDKAIQLLERLQDPEPYEPMLTKDAYDAIQMAIDALENQKSVCEEYCECEDCEAEKMVVQSLSSLYPLQEFEEIAIDKVLDAVEHPKRIKGHWICDISWSEGVGMGESYGHYWKCDKCGHLEQGDWGECGCNFCSNCGSDNREVTT